MGEAWLPLSIEEAETTLGFNHPLNHERNSAFPSPSTPTSPSSPSPTPPSSGFAAHPEQLLNAHMNGAGHLGEVQDLHAKMLYTAGELPEAHLANILPERKMSWAVEALGGIIRQSGLTIPLKGTTLGRVELTKGELYGHPAVKLNLLDAELIRTIPLPSTAENVTATWENGYLHLTWN